MTTTKPRWQYRFENYTRAYFLLQEISDRAQREDLEQIAKEGMIQRFKYCMELAWKTLKDYMENQGHVFSQVLPKMVIREAETAKLIDDPEIWLRALDDRNEMSHTFNCEKFEQVIERIGSLYVEACFSALYETLVAVAQDRE